MSEKHRDYMFDVDPSYIKEEADTRIPKKFDMRCPNMVKKYGSTGAKYNNWHSSLCAERILNNNPCTFHCKEADRIRKILKEKNLLHIRPDEFEY